MTQHRDPLIELVRKRDGITLAAAAEAVSKMSDAEKTALRTPPAKPKSPKGTA